MGNLPIGAWPDKYPRFAVTPGGLPECRSEAALPWSLAYRIAGFANH